MEKISEMMDGELTARECRSQIRRIEGDPALTDGWETYHLIRDALRNEVAVGPAFHKRLHEQLEKEPAILAPHMRLTSRAVRYTLPMAAGLAGVAIVGWLALSSSEMPGTAQTVAERAPAAPAATAAAAVTRAAPADGPVRDYMLAHQEFSPSTAMQGVVSYVRTVSADETPGGQ
jgi:sigma-E factor negative regulatory protein RseA